LIVKDDKNFRPSRKRISRRKGAFYGLFVARLCPLAAGWRYSYLIYAQGQ
jgi:hypothetical protein